MRIQLIVPVIYGNIYSGLHRQIRWKDLITNKNYVNEIRLMYYKIFIYDIFDSEILY